jgi:hypothetical protein
MNTPCLMQLLQVKMNGHLLEDGRLSNCADDFLRMVEEEAGFNSIYEDLAQMEEIDLAWHEVLLGLWMIMREQSTARLMKGWQARMAQTQEVELRSELNLFQ